MADDLLTALRLLTGRGDAEFRPGQAEAINALVAERRRVLVVQRTGWGKSAVYFLATHLLRRNGSGPTLLVSPLLSLMRNQQLAANRLGIRAEAITYENTDQWPSIHDALVRDEVDLLLVSPERFSNRDFAVDFLPIFGRRTGLVVVDEVHCISDWGHDFRRIVGILDRLPSGVPVLGCTATANERVIDYVVQQLGTELLVLRGPLGREGLRLEVHDVPSPSARLAWLAQQLLDLPGTGIVYCLTVEDTRMVAEFLRSRGIHVEPYFADLEHLEKKRLEDDLLANRVKSLVASTALGMGFDKPDLGFVVHFQAPGSPIAYYQQVGRAGRAVDSSVGVLLRGSEDERIQDWFIDHAFPTQADTEQVLQALARVDGGLRRRELEAVVNVRPKRLELLLKHLEVGGHVQRGPDNRLVRTLATWTYPTERVERVTSARRREQQQMLDYASTESCRMAFMRRLLDDHLATDCGICDRCAPRSTPLIDPELESAARSFLRHQSVFLEPRKQWPSGLPLLRGNLRPDERVEPGRALSRWGRGPIAESVRHGKQVTSRFDDRLVDESVELIRRRWDPQPPPVWVTYVPSLREPALVADFAERLARALGLPLQGVVRKVLQTRPQKEMQNGAMQALNIYNAFAVDQPSPKGPVLLVDDMVDSRWTFTIIGRLLRRAGVPAVYPFALASTAGSSE